MRFWTRQTIALTLGLGLFLGGRAQAETIAVFDNGTYVDNSSTTPFGHLSQEATNVQNILTGYGHAITTFAGTDAASWTAAGIGVNAILIPKIEPSDDIHNLDPEGNFAPKLGNDLDAAARQAIRDYVAGGGVLIVMGGAGHNWGSAANFLNSVFNANFMMTNLGISGSTLLNADHSLNTAFEGAPGQIDRVNGANYPVIHGMFLPPETFAIYGEADNTDVFVTVYGLGEIIYLGWDGVIGGRTDACTQSK
jgi:hypothetical protein